MAKDSSKKNGMIAYTHPVCKIGRVGYSSHFDAYFCPHCDRWLSKICGYSPPDCKCHCEKRPEKPSETEL